MAMMQSVSRSVYASPRCVSDRLICNKITSLVSDDGRVRSTQTLVIHQWAGPSVEGTMYNVSTIESRSCL